MFKVPGILEPLQRAAFIFPAANLSASSEYEMIAIGSTVTEEIRATTPGDLIITAIEQFPPDDFHSGIWFILETQNLGDLTAHDIDTIVTLIDAEGNVAYTSPILSTVDVGPNQGVAIEVGLGGISEVPEGFNFDFRVVGYAEDGARPEPEPSPSPTP